MEAMTELAAAQRALALFETEKERYAVQPYGNGHINGTFLATPEEGGTRYILQRINRRVFPSPEQVMDNISRVTRHLKARIAARGGDPLRETLTLVPARAGGDFVCSDGEVYRLYLFVEGTVSYDLPDTPALFQRCAMSFGRFQREMDGFDAGTLHEVIPNFHCTPARYEQLDRAVRENAAGRLSEAEDALAFALKRRGAAATLTDALKSGDLPLRVTHNDTKLNNILMDAQTGEGLCVIDLDTVMPGLAAYDFGDSIRTGGSTAAEDETDLTRVGLSLPMFRAYFEGYLNGCGGALSAKEISLLPRGAWTMTLECGVRFLADYINGDVYFRVHRAYHNLERARCQFALVADMERHWDDMMAIARELGGE